MSVLGEYQATSTAVGPVLSLAIPEGERQPKCSFKMTESTVYHRPYPGYKTVNSRINIVIMGKNSRQLKQPHGSGVHHLFLPTGRSQGDVGSLSVPVLGLLFLFIFVVLSYIFACCAGPRDTSFRSIRTEAKIASELWSSHPQSPPSITLAFPVLVSSCPRDPVWKM